MTCDSTSCLCCPQPCSSSSSSNNRTIPTTTSRSSRSNLVLLTLIYLGLSTIQFLYHSYQRTIILSDNGGSNSSSSKCHCKESSTASSSLKKSSSKSSSAPPTKTPPPTTKKTSAVLCLYGNFPGQTFNRIITIANAMAAAHEASNATTTFGVGLFSAAWSDWYLSFLDAPPNETTTIENDENDDIVPVVPVVPKIHLYYRGECAGDLLHPNETYWRYGYNFASPPARPFLQSLLPKREFRRQAASIMAQWKTNSDSTPTSAAATPTGSTAKVVTTVHRRNLDGQCHRVALDNQFSLCHVPASSNNKRGGSLSTTLSTTTTSSSVPLSPFTNASIADRLAICDLNYSMVQAAMWDATTTTTNDNDMVVLFTDGQVPALDDTFPLVANFSFAVEVWLMVLSDVHYGSPFSTIDYVVYLWRQALSSNQKGDYSRHSQRGAQRSISSSGSSVSMKPESCYP